MRLYECLILPCYEFLVFSCQCEFLVFSCVNFLSSSVRMSFIIWSIRSQYVACHQLDQFFLCFFPTSSICTSVLNSFMPVRWRNISSAWGWVARVFESGRFQASSVSMISPTCLHTFDSESIPFHSIPISFFLAWWHYSLSFPCCVTRTIWLQDGLTVYYLRRFCYRHLHNLAQPAFS